MSGSGWPVAGSGTPVIRAKPTGRPSKFSAGVGLKPATDAGAGSVVASDARIAKAMQGCFVGMDGFRAGQKTEPFEIVAVPKQAGPVNKWMPGRSSATNKA